MEFYFNFIDFKMAEDKIFGEIEGIIGWIQEIKKINRGSKVSDSKKKNYEYYAEK